MIETMDPTTWITDQGDGFICYQNSDGKSWVITGYCNRCGACEPFSLPPGQTAEYLNYVEQDGVVSTYTRHVEWYGTPGTPDACSEVNYQGRKDIPITPEMVNEITECVLNGAWD